MYAMATSGWRRKTARLAVAATLLLTSAALPALDGDMFLGGERIEAEHSSSACAYLHDHVLCVQWAGSRWLATPERTGLLRTQILAHSQDARTDLIPAVALRIRPNSRAPPTT